MRRALQSTPSPSALPWASASAASILSQKSLGKQPISAAAAGSGTPVSNSSRRYLPGGSALYGPAQGSASEEDLEFAADGGDVLATRRVEASVRTRVRVRMRSSRQGARSRRLAVAAACDTGT